MFTKTITKFLIKKEYCSNCKNPLKIRNVGEDLVRYKCNCGFPGPLTVQEGIKDKVKLIQRIFLIVIVLGTIGFITFNLLTK